MTGKRTRYSADFKAKVALEAIRGELTIAAAGGKHGMHQTMVGEWKRQAMEGLAAVFSGKSARRRAPRRPRRMSRSCTPRSASWWWNGIFWPRRPVDQPRSEAPDGRAGPPRLSIVRQCELVSISRSGFYHRPAGETALNLELMRLIDAQFLETPWYGARQMARHLRREGYTVGRKRIRRLMAKMG